MSFTRHITLRHGLIGGLVTAADILQKKGLVSRLPINAEDVFAFRDEYIRERNLIAWNFYHPEDASQQVNIVINYDLDINHRTFYTTRNTEIALLAKQPLIHMERESGRAQDLEGVAALEILLKEDSQ